MRKVEFKRMYKSSGIGRALKVLLKDIPGRTIEIPKEEYLPENILAKDVDITTINMWKAMHVIDHKTYECTVSSFAKEMKGQCRGVTSMHLEKGTVKVETFDVNIVYRQTPVYFDITELDELDNLYMFALSYAKFDEPTIRTAADLTDRQLELLDDFTEAARRLNEAGVSLIWDEDGNNLCVANRDQMKDESYFRLELDQELPEGAVRLSEKASNAIDVEIHTMSENYDLYYFPQE